MYTGKGMMQQIEDNTPFTYNQLDLHVFEKFLRSINRHRYRGEDGRFAKKPQVVLYNNHISIMKTYKAIIDDRI